MVILGISNCGEEVISNNVFKLIIFVVQIKGFMAQRSRYITNNFPPRGSSNFFLNWMYAYYATYLSLVK